MSASTNAPKSTLHMPTKRSCPSVSLTSLENISRHEPGLRRGMSPSNTSIRPSAAHHQSTTVAYFRAGAAEAGPPVRSALKNSLFGSITMTSFLLRNASR